MRRSAAGRVFDRAVRWFHRLVGVPYLGHIPGPRGLEFVRLMRHFQRDSLGALEVTHERYGPIASYPWPISTVIIYEPAAVGRVLIQNQRNYVKGAQTEEMNVVMGDGLVTNNDRRSWAKSRAVVNKAMSAGSVRSFVPVFAEYADALVAKWNQVAQSGGGSKTDVWRAMRTITFQIAGKALLGANLRPEDGTAIDDAVRYTSGVVHDHMFQLFPVPYWVPTPVNRKFNRHRDNLDRIVGRLIEASRESPAPQGARSILDQLVHGVDPDSGEPLSDRVLRDEVVTLLIAGYETTANTLAWVFATIAAHPTIQARLHTEIDAAGLDVDWATLRQTHPQTYCTILEAVRLYTVIAMSSRRTLQEDVLSGYRVPPNTSVVVPTWVLHRDSEHWSDPLEFRPERFSGCPASQMSAYVPFSKGERGCVGQTFATVEVAVIVVRVLAEFSLSLPGDMPRPISHVSLTPQGGLHLDIEPRSRAQAD
ncbi:MAG: cytochrome P450 [Nannocystales bacterium]